VSIFAPAPAPPLSTVAVPAPPASGQPVSFRRRFGIAYILLATVVGAAVGLLVVVLLRDDSTPDLTATRWSAWTPNQTGTLGVRQIGRFIAPRYELKKSKPLVGIIAGSMELPTSNGPVPVTAILVQSGKAGVATERLSVAYPQAGAFYQLCGSSANCTIPGSSSTERGQLLQREALELALYTFHYLPESDHVLVFLPPPPGVQPTDPKFHRAIYLQRENVLPSIVQPLDRTLRPLEGPLMPGNVDPVEWKTINALTTPRVFHFEFQGLADQSAAAVLSPLP
jgi:hypothetical protein